MSTKILSRSLIAALAVLLLVSGPVAAQEPTACVPPAAGTPRVVTGTGQTQSAPFTLDGGAYRVEWTMAAPSDRLSFIELKSADDPSVLRSHTILNASGAAGATSGQTHLYNVQPGPYYLSVRAPGGWSVTLTPIAV